MDTSNLPVEEQHIYPEGINEEEYIELAPEITDSLAIKPAQIYVKRIVRHKYVLKSSLQIQHPEQQAFKIAPLPPSPINKCMASSSLLADIIIEKFHYHLPFYRVIQKYKELGVTISSSTIGDWYAAVCEKLKILYDRLKEDTRRKFYDAHLENKKLALEGIEYISGLYKIESESVDYTVEQRAERRQKESYPIILEFEQWLEDTAPKVLKSGRMYKAIQYAYGLLPRLRRYVQDGRYHIDNNLIENVIRPLAIGRKNYLFCGDIESAVRAGIVYSLLESCKASNVDPRMWLEGREECYNWCKLSDAYKISGVLKNIFLFKKCLYFCEQLTKESLKVKEKKYSVEQEQISRFAKAMGHPARVAILAFLAKQDNCFFGDIHEELPIAKATVSQHLKELKEAGLIQGEIETPKVRYCINRENWEFARRLFANFLGDCKSKEESCCK